MDSIRDTFFEECEDLLEQLSDGLTAIQDGVQDVETINAVFRAVHSIKGGAGAFGLDDLVSFAHKYENVLDELRSQRLEFSDTLIEVLQRASDQLANLVEALRDETPWDEDQISDLAVQLEAMLGANGPDAEDLDFQPMAIDLGLDLGVPGNPSETFHISFKPSSQLLRNGHEPIFLFQELAALGELETRLDQSDLVTLDELDPSELSLKWSLTLTTGEGEDAILRVFEFVEGLCDLTIEKPAEEVKPPDLPEPIAEAQLPEDTSPEEIQPKAKPVNATLRVDIERVDRLVNTIGELIINQAMLSQGISELSHDGLRDIEDQLESYRQLARDLQEDVMALRAQPVKPLFQRMGRIVREAAASTEKSARLVLQGEGTEVDKTLIERLADPLTHMVRNAVDHGLEDRQARHAAGKNETGQILLSAAHRSGSVFIEISDDGAGLDRAKILEIAIKKGLVPEGAEFTDGEIDNLLFLPGFSTASSVSNLSGRGVGMDVVRNAVAALGGRVTISSTPGEGTRFSVVVPLTLAVMDGMVVRVGEHKMVLPLAGILETIRPEEDALFYLGTEGPYISVRGALVPVIDVAKSFHLETGQQSQNRPILILVETQGSGQCAFSLSAILDQRQVVIKSLDGIDDSSPGVAAATILGNGEIAMILDPDGIVETSQRPVWMQHKNGEQQYAAAG